MENLINKATVSLICLGSLVTETPYLLHFNLITRIALTVLTVQPILMLFGFPHYKLYASSNDIYGL
jgi:hypothetical protein